MINARCDQHFDAFDADRDGKITKQEFSSWPHAWGDADTLFQERDADQDGTITKDELCSGQRGGSRP
jgi:Ca2+-binding EF-hand superfamily protein